MSRFNNDETKQRLGGGIMRSWGEKPYHSLDYELKQRFGEKVYKLTLNGGMSCPNRDGKISFGGCIFCSEGGSGEFAAAASLSIPDQIQDAKKRLLGKRPVNQYIAYFQAYTNTYGPIEHLRKIFTDAIHDPEIVLLSIATRPDCLNQEIMDLIYEIHMIKPVFIELGLQSSNETTASYIRRGYSNDIFENAVALIDSYNKKIENKDNHIHIIVHTIIGLPGENINHMLETIKYINKFAIHGVKLQLLHVLTDTDLAIAYEKNPFPVLSLEEYTDILIKLLEHLRPDIVIHRMTGDGPKNILIAPEWSKNKRNVLNYINKQLTIYDTVQGSAYLQDKGD